MTVSFDLDDTLLIKATGSTPSDPSFAEVFGPTRELRKGTIALLRRLSDTGFNLAIYTNSYRGRARISEWFRDHGVSITNVITQVVHEQEAEAEWQADHPVPQKFPPWFGIDVHIDDSMEVARDGEKHGFEVVLISPDDPDWAESVWDSISSRKLGQKDAPD